MTFMRYTAVELPTLGQIYVGYSESGISWVSFSPTSDAELAAVVRARHGCGVWRDDSLQARWQDGLRLWAAGGGSDLPLDLSRVTPFERAVMEQTRSIARGTVRTYQWLARAVGRPGASRTVGNVMRRNPVPLLVPCHRVVASSGLIGNYSMGGPGVKRHLLEMEGVDTGRLKEYLALEAAR